VFPSGLWDRAATHLRANGAERLEQLILWAGYPVAGAVVIASLLMPETEAEWGWVHVVPAEQPRIVEWLIQHRQLMFAEAHTHGGGGPWATEMSQEDRRHPAGRQDGFLTMIVPAYAQNGVDLGRMGVWECRDLIWQKLSPQEVKGRIRIGENEEIRYALA
jgi:hypothetical protein